MVYLIVILLLLILSLQSNKEYKVGFPNRKKYWAFIALTGIAAFAYMLGSDTPEYVLFYQKLPKISYLLENPISQYRYQPGFIYLCSALKTFSSNYLLYQVFHAIVINFVIFRFVNKYSVNPYLALLAYVAINFLEFNFEIQRESFAVIFGLFAYESYNNKKFLLYAAFVILAFYFHVSAVVLLLIPLSLFIRPSKISLIIIIGIAASAPWIWSVIPNAELFLALMTDSEFYSGYLIQEINAGYNMHYYIMFYITNLLIPLAFLFFTKEKAPAYSMLVLVYIIFKMLSLFSYGFYRFSNYFVCFYWLAIAESTLFVVQKYKLNMLFIYIAVFLVIGYTNQTKLKWYDDENSGYIYERYFPYRSVLSAENSYTSRK